jgi:hypothetical protein
VEFIETPTFTALIAEYSSRGPVGFGSCDGRIGVEARVNVVV